MEYAIGVGIASLVIIGFLLCITLFFIGWAIQVSNDKKNEKLQLEYDRKMREKADKVKTQSTPSTVNKETSFEITNVKESVLVTEVVYAD